VPRTPALDDLISVKEAAARVGCAELTIRRGISRGDVRAYRFGRLIRIDAADLARAFRPVTNAADLAGGGRFA